MALQERKRRTLIASLLFIACSRILVSSALAASANDAVFNAKQEAQVRGKVFITTHEEIVSKAKAEGKLRVMTGLLGSVKTTTEAFKKKYPFIDLQRIETIRSADNAQQAFLEMKAGTGKDWDIARTYTDQYNE